MRIAVERTALGPLMCHVVSADTPPEWAVILCHGFGAPGTDLVPLGGELFQQFPELVGRVAFVFPEAPLSLGDYGMAGGRAWWPIDMLRLQRAIELGEFRDLRTEQPALLPSSREKLQQTLAAIREKYDLPMSRIVLGGFSQGAMIATDLTLRLEEPPAALLIYSGTLLNEAEWTTLAPGRSGLRVLQSHGHDDPILPYENAEWLHDLLTRSGLDVTFLPFPGGHTIPRAALMETGRLVGELRVERKGTDS